ncbi:MAG: hypothetical protein K1000chlam4_00829 [Chlamydiae bacterium]|nr:hypothetical protein [Chlamydiota bacterium]
MKKCLVYANCQGDALAHWLNKNSLFSSEYVIDKISNYEHIFDQKKIPKNLFRRADLCIYQPIGNSHGIYATSNLLRLLKPSCKTISFPYIYNDGLWPIYKNGDKIVNQEPIVELIQQGCSLLEIMTKFISRNINFKLKERFENSLNELRKREQETDLKGAQYILDNYQHKKLFLTCNHPATNLIIHYMNQVLKQLNLPMMQNSEQFHPNDAGLPGCYPSSPYGRKELNIFYKEESDWKVLYEKKKRKNWRYIHLAHIFEVYSQQAKKEIGNFPKWLRSLSKYW